MSSCGGGIACVCVSSARGVLHTCVCVCVCVCVCLTWTYIRLNGGGDVYILWVRCMMQYVWQSKHVAGGWDVLKHTSSGVSGSC